MKSGSNHLLNPFSISFMTGPHHYITHISYANSIALINQKVISSFLFQYYEISSSQYRSWKPFFVAPSHQTAYGYVKEHPILAAVNASVYETLGAAGFIPIRLHFRPRGADPLNNLVNPNVLYTLLTAAFFL
ncbi:MAG: hypothetical protein ABRQ39_26565, partial [Candidatus Eremiobacterota bacterium]